MRTWSLRRRLSTGVALVVLAVGIAISSIVLVSARQMLINGIDEALFAARGRPGFGAPAGGAPGPTQDLAQTDPGQDTDPAGRPPPPPTESGGFLPFGVVFLDSTGVVSGQMPSGFEDGRNPLVDVASIDSNEVANAADDTYLNLRDMAGDSLRGLVTPQPDGGWTIFTQSQEAADGVIRRLLLISMLATVGAAGLGASGAWFLVQRGFRPVDDMVDAAAAIASGERNRRIDTEGEATELGRLGVALDHMMDQLSVAEAERDADAVRLRQFVDDASHELRTPVTTIVGYVELYEQGGVTEPAQLKRAMARIGEAGGRAERLIEDLLALTRLENEISMRSEPVELRPLIEELADDTAVSSGREVVTDIAQGATVLGDRLWLHQALANIVRNALAHAPADRPITLRLAAHAGRAEIAVIDHGPGVPEAEWERVFDRFARPDQGRSRTEGGAGLGLAIVRGIATEHSGTVAFGETPGGGATVTLSIPLHDKGLV